MRRRAPKMIGLMIVLIIGVFVGMEWAQSGIERVNGPLDYSEQERNQSYLDDRQLEPDQGVSQASVGSNQPDEIWIDIDRKPVRYVRGDQAADEQSQPESEVLVPTEPLEPLVLSEPPANDAPVNQLADKAAGMLQQMSEAGMKAVVGVFSGLF